MRAYRNSSYVYIRHPYQYIQTLSQDFPQNMDAQEVQLEKLH